MEKKKEIFPYGIPDHNLTEIEREIPIEEPPAWPINAKLKEVGKRRKRYDAKAKVTGEATYTSDIRLPGMLYAKFLRSNVPHASIRTIDTSAAEQLPGVLKVKVITTEMEGEESFPDVKYVGQPIAAVAAETLAIAKDAIAKIKVIYDEKPFVINIDEALAEKEKDWMEI